MPSRNTALLTQVIEALDGLRISEPHGLARLEDRFKDSLLIVAGDVTKVAEHAEKLRLAITTPESAVVLDHIGNEALAGITIDHVEDAINTLFPDRFIEP